MKLTVLGPGCWGLTIAKLENNNFDEVCVWGRSADITPELKEQKRISKPLEIQLDKKVEITSDMKIALQNADIILLVVSTTGVRPVCEQIKAAGGLNKNQIMLNLSKGIELHSLKRMSEVVSEVLPDINFGVLSGPTLAREIIEGKPTLATIASNDMNVAKRAQELLNVPSLFRLYTNSDVIGVELGGSLKNVVAIASGFASSMGLGDNLRGSLLTRGMAEMTRVALSMGAKVQTLYGLSGLGDLIATASSPYSRNYTVGSLLAQGKKIDDILANLGSVAEGVKTSKALCELADKLNIEVPVARAIYEAVYTDITPEETVKKLMNRKLKEED